MQRIMCNYLSNTSQDMNKQELQQKSSKVLEDVAAKNENGQRHLNMNKLSLSR
jgi:hypothetical protein